MTQVGIITQARMTSTRLPGKVLMRAGNATMLEHHLRRLARSGYPVYVATTTNSADDPIVDCAEALQVPSFRGSETDVLARFAGAAAVFGLDVVVRVTSDCPLIDGSLVAQGVETYLRRGTPDTYVSNTLERTYPRGFDFEVFSTVMLDDADSHAHEPAQREHVTPYFYQNVSGRMTLISLRRPVDASRFRLTLDTPEDLRALTRLIETFDAARLSAEEIIDVMEHHDEIAALNAGVRQKPLA